MDDSFISLLFFYLDDTMSVAELREGPYYLDVAKLTAALYTYWGSTFLTPSLGLYHFNRQYFLKYGDASCRVAFDKDLPYWQSSRVYDNFYNII